MQVGFFHPNLGYWETDEEPPEDIRAGYPDGTLPVPVKPSPFHHWVDGAWTVEPSARANQRAEAMAVVNAKHAQYLEALTGSATQAERDTWPRKLMAARAILAGSATASDEATLSKGADQRGISLADFAAVIVARDAEFVAVVDAADAIRDKAKSAIDLATDDAVPTGDVADLIEAALAELAREAESAAANLQPTNV